MRINLIPFLELIAGMLFLEPVLRFLLAKGFINKDGRDAIKNPYVNETEAARNEALVHHIDGNERAVEGFMEALKQTGQEELAERIESGNDADSGKTPSDKESTQSSERSRKLREKQWTCPGLPGFDECPSGSEGQWDNAFLWCRVCRLYLCASCLQSEQHKHKPCLRAPIKSLHAAAYDRVKKDDAREKRELCKFADDVGHRVSEVVQDYLLTQWDQQSSLHAFEDNLFVHMAAPPTMLLTTITSQESRAALVTATANMGGSVPQPKDVIPDSLKDILHCAPKMLLNLLLAPRNMETLPEETEEPQVDDPEEATVVGDDETQAMVPEEPEVLPDLAFLVRSFVRSFALQEFLEGLYGSGDGHGYVHHGVHHGPSPDDIYGTDAKPELTPPPLLKLLMTSPVNDQGHYPPTVMAEVASAGDELLALRDARGLTALHIVAWRGATGLLEHILGLPDVDVDVKDVSGHTPLITASMNGNNKTAAELLIHAEADIMAKNSRNETAIHIACKVRDPPLLQTLLKKLPRDEVDASNEIGQTALFVAAKIGSTECMELLLEAGADVNMSDNIGNIPLHSATATGHLDAVKLILAKSRQLINAQNEYGFTPLLLACYLAETDVAKALLAEGADPLITDQEGNDAIYWAACSGSVALVEDLIARGSPINSNQRKSCLAVACIEGHLEVVKQLVEKGADVFHRDTAGFSAMAMSCQEGSIEILNFLLSRPIPFGEASRRQECAGDALVEAALSNQLPAVKALISSGSGSPDHSSTCISQQGSQAIHAAAQSGHSSIVDYLLSERVNPDAVDNEGATPLMLAAAKGQLECVRRLLEGGASAAFLSPVGTALHLAVKHGHVETTTFLLSVTPKEILDVCRSSDGSNILHLAASCGDMGIFRQLCQHGANLGARMVCGSSVLHMAAQEGHLEIVNYVLEQEEGSMLLDSKGKGGTTALMMAAGKGQTEVVKTLFKKGADPCAQCGVVGFALTALHFAAKSDSLQTLQLFVNHESVYVNEQDGVGLTPIMRTSCRGFSEGVELLVEAGADVNIRDATGQTALHYAAFAEKNGSQTAEILIAAGASAHKADDDQNTCLHVAAAKGNADVAGTLLSSKQLDTDVLKWNLFTPLHFAVYAGNVEAVKMLLGFGADAASPVCGKTPLEWAKHEGRRRVARVLERHLEAAGGVSGQTKASSWVKDLPE